MGEISIPVNIQSDNDGFISFQCPLCSMYFKINIHELENDEEIFIEFYCPYCGLKDEINNFRTEEFHRHVELLLEKKAIEIFNDSFIKLEKSINKNKNISMKVNKIPQKNVPELKENYFDEEIIHCKYCNKSMKISSIKRNLKHFCVYCGLDL